MNDEKILQSDLKPVYSDLHYAKEIRETIKSLAILANDATKAGLQVTFNLNNIGKPEWVGYQDAVTIIRKY